MTKEVTTPHLVWVGPSCAAAACLQPDRRQPGVIQLVVIHALARQEDT
jgi:hypothetical protein